MANNKNFIPAKSKFSKQPRSVESLLPGTARSLRIATKLKQYEAFPHWAEIVGERIAAVAVPEKISGGNMLVVRVIDVAWAQELSLEKTTILDKIQKAAIGAHIDDIRFVVGNPKSLSNRR